MSAGRVCHETSLPRRRQRALALLLGPLAVLFGCASGPATSPWTGECPPGAGSQDIFLVVLSLSASERDEQMIDGRLDRSAEHVKLAVDCEARFELVILETGRATLIHSADFESAINTERARDLNVPGQAAEAMATIRAGIAPYVAAEPEAGSDPGAAFRVLGDRLLRMGGNGQIFALVLSDGVTITNEVDLNRRIEASEIAGLVAEVAPAVDLGGRVHLDWPSIGRTVDAEGAPRAWIDTLVEIWTEVCRSRGGKHPCLITST